MPFFDRRSETLPRESLVELQGAKLTVLLESLYGHNRFYTDKMRDAGVIPADIRSVEDLERLPLTTKLELSEAAAAHPPFGTNMTYAETEYTRVHQTSGTTGPPLKVLDTDESWDWWGRCWGYVLAGAGVTSTDRLFVPFSFGPFIGFWGAVEGARRIGALMIPAGGADSVERLYRMGDQGATAMCCTPTYALRLAEVAESEAVDIRRLPVRRIITAGEPGGNVPDIKQRIESAWGAKCFDHAGASEVGAHSFECEHQPGATHAIEPEFIFEVLDVATHEPVPQGQDGELVITNLGRLGFPAIRYRTGDRVRLSTEPCACGRTLARFEGGVLGRADDMVIVRGVNIFPEAVENLVRRVDAVCEYQITVSTPTDLAQLAIAIEVAEGADPDDTRLTVTKDIHNVLGLRPVVTVAPRESLPRFEFKARRFHVDN
jgi:phenylacetate-CoA ligase